MFEQLGNRAETVEKPVSPKPLFGRKTPAVSAAEEKARTAVKRAMADRPLDVKQELSRLDLQEMEPAGTRFAPAGSILKTVPASPLRF